MSRMGSFLRSLAALTAVLYLTTPAHAQTPITRFVSVPDFINMDLQFKDPRLFDLTNARQAALVAEINASGPQASINPNVGNFIGTVENGYRGASQVLLEAIAAENTDFLTVSGDMLYTRWPKGSQLGQPLATSQQHIRDQADIYYDGWVQSVSTYGGYDYAAGEVFTVIGDHEVGDNNWPADKRALLPTYYEVYKDKLGNPDLTSNGAYANAPAGLEGRTYAVQRGNMLLVGLDQFANISNNTGPIDVTGSQLAWLDSTLTTANSDPTIEHIVVLGHAPIAKQSQVKVQHSSGLMNDSDENGALWQTFATHGVDLYLPGEVHAMSMQTADDVLQVVTGTNIFQETDGPSAPNVPYDLNNPLTSEQNYMVVDTYADRIELTLKQIETKVWGFRGLGNDPLNDDPYKDREARVEIATANAGFQTIGRLTIDTTGPTPVYSEVTGLFSTYLAGINPPTDPPTYAGTTTPITGWVQIIDTQAASSGITGANTNSPIVGDGDGATIAAEFDTVTLEDGDFLTLSGTFEVDAPLGSNQFRWGLFEGDNPPTQGDGNGYAGINAAAGDNLSSNAGIRFGNGTATNPFTTTVSGVSTDLGFFAPTAADVGANDPLDFLLTIIRDGDHLDIVAYITNNDDYAQLLVLEDQVVSQYTYDNAAFLIGGAMDGTVSTFSNIELTTGSVFPIPGDTDGDGDVDDADLGTAFANYTGPIGAAGNKSAAQGDTDGDGDVDDADLGVAFAGYTGPLNAAETPNVPEPAGAMLLPVGLALLARRRSRDRLTPIGDFRIRRNGNDGNKIS